MIIAEIIAAYASGAKFKVPQHKMYSVYPPFSDCKGTEGRIFDIQDQTEAQALIVICCSCSERWGISIDDFPDVTAMDPNHLLIEGFHYKDLLEITVEKSRQQELNDNFVNNRQSHWESGNV